jgi:hypothetical protein
MKYLIIILFLLANKVCFAQSPLDSSFGNNGIVLFPQFAANHGSAVGMQTDGKILCYYTSSVSCFGHYFFRLWPNGNLDSTFIVPSGFGSTTPPGLNGILYISGSGLPDPGQTFIRQTSDNGIVVGISGGAVFKLKSNGNLDTNYGNISNFKGWANLNSSATIPYLNTFFDFYEDANGDYYYCGPSFNRDSILIVKTNTNGILQNNYGTNGLLSVPISSSVFGFSRQLYGAKFASNGQLFVYGQCSNTGTNFDGFIGKYNLNGTIDNTFGNAGGIIKDYASFEAFMHLTQYNNGDLYLSGHYVGEVFTLKLNAAGVVDNTFGANGKAIHPYPINAQNPPYVIGVPYANNTPLYITQKISPVNFYNLQSYNSINNNGTINNNFGTNGTWNTTANYRIDAMVSQADGAIVCLGSDSLHARILRYKSDQHFPAAINNANPIYYYQDYDAIYLSNNTTIESIKLYNIQGQLLQNNNKNKCVVIDNYLKIITPNTIPKGIYFLQINTLNNVSKTVQFEVQ